MTSAQNAQIITALAKLLPLGKKFKSAMAPPSRARNWCFTSYKPTLATAMVTALDGVPCEYIFQEERCPNTGRLHLQGYVAFKDARTMSSVKNILGDPAVHLEQSKKKNRAAAELYCAKKASSTGPLWSNWYERPIDPLQGKTLYWWQQMMMDIIEEKPDERTVYWLWEPNGQAGKSAMVRHLAIEMGNKFLLVQGKGADIKFAVKECKVKPKVILWDLPRSAMDDKNMPIISYTAIEQVKNAIFFSSKYESGMVLMNYPHIFIMANAPPDMSKLSGDRWKVYELKSPKASVDEAESLGIEW